MTSFPQPKSISGPLSDCLAYYVYLLIDPRDGKVFYIGKGKGQADAEITHVGLKRIRKGTMAVVVTNDKVVQRFADQYLSVRVFSDFIASH